MNKLEEWLSKHTLDFVATGTHHFFRSGNDQDFLVHINQIPGDLVDYIPEPKDDIEYDEGISRVQVESKQQDFIICYTYERIEEFKHANKFFVKIEDDCPESYKKLKDDKQLRVAVFRALRSTHPNSELNY